MQNNKMTSLVAQPIVASKKRLSGSCVGFEFYVPGLGQTCPCTGRTTTTFKSNDFCILGSVSVNQSGGFSIQIGVLYLPHDLLVLAELIVCSTRAFQAKWFWPTVTSLSLTYVEVLKLHMLSELTHISEDEVLD